MPIAYIGIGSNIGAAENVLKAVSFLSERVIITGISTIYLTEPFDQGGQPLFYNGVVRVETEFEPRYLKYGILKEIEKKLGRQRTKDKSSARTIDLDMLLYGNMVIDDEGLEIPDPGIRERPFLAVPLYELDRHLILPGWNQTISDVAEKLMKNDMKPLLEYTEQLRRMVKNGY
jgi:2-amino-4-hydroxy-6-hydroxymethyldihydropteridine diphosphokinase